MDEKKGKLSLQISSKKNPAALAPRLAPGTRSQCGKIILKKLGTAFLIEFLVYIMFWKKQKDFEVPISGLPIFANVANSRSERFSSSENIDIIRHKFLCQFFAKRGTTCAPGPEFLQLL